MSNLSSGSPEQLRPDWRSPAPHQFAREDQRYEAAMAAHDAAAQAGEAGYLDPTTGLFVMTAASLAARPCCGNLCRHCPWQRSPG